METALVIALMSIAPLTASAVVALNAKKLNARWRARREARAAL